MASREGLAGGDRAAASVKETNDSSTKKDTVKKFTIGHDVPTISYRLASCMGKYSQIYSSVSDLFRMSPKYYPCFEWFKWDSNTFRKVPRHFIYSNFNN